MLGRVQGSMTFVPLGSVPMLGGAKGPPAFPPHGLMRPPLPQPVYWAGAVPARIGRIARASKRVIGNTSSD